MTAIQWKSGIGGNFDDASKWSTATVPASLDDALIDASGTYTVESLTARTVHSLTMAIGATLEIGIGDFTLDFFGADANNGTINVYSHLTVFGALDNTGVIHCFGAPIPNVPPHPLAYFQPLGTSTNSGAIEAINDAEIFFNISPVNGPASFTNYGIIEAFGGSIITIGGNFGATSSFTNVGTIEALGQGSIVDLFSTSGTITNSGHLVANGGTIQISNPNSISGSGTAEIRNGGTLFIGTSFAENTTFDPGANGTLQLGSGAVFTGTLSGFTTGDRIDFAGLQYSGSTLTFDPTNDVLTVSNGGYAPTIHLSGSYVTSGFKLSADASGFAQVTYTVPPANHPPQIDLAHSTLSGTINERPSTTGSLALDTANGAIAFMEADLSDRPTASVTHLSVTWQDSQGHQFQLTDDQVFKFENALLFVPESGNTNNGKIDWGFTIADNALDFLGAGETVTVTKTVEIDDGHGGKVDQDVTVTINGANDVPVPWHDIAIVTRGTTQEVDAKRGLLANDVDADAHDPLSVSSIIFNGRTFSVSAGYAAVVHGNWGTLSVNADGSYTYSASAAGGTIFPRALDAFNPIHQDLFSYRLSDGHVSGPSDQAFLDVSMTAAKSPYSSIVMLEIHHADNKVTYASGALIGPNSILTAAHAFESENGQSVTGISVLTALGTALVTENVSITLGNYSYANNGHGAPALVNGYDPLLANGHIDATHDVAVLGVSIDIGNTLGWLTPASSNSPGLYTLLGFPQNGGLLARNTFSHVDSQGEWYSLLPLGAPQGTSGGPLLSNDNHIVGVQSQTSDAHFGPVGVSLADHINSAQLADIHSWMQHDLLLI